MATIKIKFRSSSVAGKEGTLCYQVIHGRQTRLISTGYKLHLYEWDKEAGKIRSVDGNPERERYLEALRFRMEEDRKRPSEFAGGSMEMMDACLRQYGLLCGQLEELESKWEKQSHR